MDRRYEVEVTVHGATPPKGRPVNAIVFIVKACCPQVARSMALDYAKAAKVEHPRRFKNATFSVANENIKQF